MSLLSIHPQKKIKIDNMNRADQCIHKHLQQVKSYENNYRPLVAATPGIDKYDRSDYYYPQIQKKNEKYYEKWNHFLCEKCESLGYECSICRAID